ncbi:helix-turn-helix transcriptional regulator [Candidatus Riflebacteria bacterium]
MPAGRNVGMGSPGNRMLSLYFVLASRNRSFSLAELSRIFRCSRQTILRMYDELTRNQKITRKLRSWKDGRERHFQIESTGGSYSPAFSLQDIEQLLLCKEIVGHLLPDSIQNEISETIWDAKRMLPEQDRSKLPLPDFAEARGTGTIDYSEFSDIFHDLQYCIREKKLCQVNYQEKGLPLKINSYTGGPLRFISYQEAIYLQLYLFNRDSEPVQDGLRTFDVHEIKSLNVTEDDFSMPEYKDYPGYFGMGIEKPFKVKLELSQNIAEKLSERRWSSDQKFRNRNGGTVVMKFSATDYSELKTWVLGLGSEAIVLEPESLRDEIVLDLFKMQSHYKIENDRM